MTEKHQFENIYAGGWEQKNHNLAQFKDWKQKNCS